jgi:hypothetical protein
MANADIADLRPRNFKFALILLEPSINWATSQVPGKDLGTLAMPIIQFDAKLFSSQILLILSQIK